MSRKAKFIPMRILSPKNAGTILTQNRTMVKPDPEMPISPMAGAKVRMHHLPTGELVWEGKSDSQGYYYPKNLKEHEEYLPVGIHQPRNFAAVASGPVQSRPRLNASAINCTIGKPFQWKPRVHGHNVQVTLVGGELPEGMEWSQEFGLISEHVSGVAGVYNLEFQAATKYGPLLYKVALVNTLLPLRVPLGLAKIHRVDMYRSVGLRDIRVKGGEAPFTYHVVEGELPEGMYVTPDGYLTGYPVSFGKSPIVFNVADARGEEVQVGISFVGDSTILGEVSSQLDFENGYEDELTGGWESSEEGVELKKVAGFGYGTSAELTGGYIHHAHTEAYELPRDYTLEFRASFPDLDEGVLVSTRPDGLGHAPFLMEIGAEGQVVVRMSRNGGSWAITMESEPLEIDTEYFIAVGRNGDDLSLFINGETVDTAILDGQIYTNEAGMTLGADGDGSNSKNMLLDSFRLAQTALYVESEFTVISGGLPALVPQFGEVPDPHWDKVVALLHFDGDLADETGRIWQKIGDSYFGSGVFGSGLLLTRPNPNSNGLYSNGVVLDSDFTIEFFISSNHTADEQCIVSCYMGSGSTGYTWEVFLEKTTGILCFYHHSGSIGSYVLVSGNKVADGVVHHIAVTREGGMLRLFVDGRLHDSHDEFREYTAEAPLCIGYQHGGTGRFPLKGMVDELRITKGVARYTDNFTPPTEPFPSRGLA